MQADDECWQFGPFLVDRRRRLLLAGGKPVKLDARAFDLLEYLVDRRHEEPTRDEILAHVWRGTTVSEGNLSVQLSALRRTLLDHGGGDKLILTLPGRRYRFVGDLHEATGIAGSQPPSPPTLSVQAPATEIAEPPARRKHLLITAGAGVAIMLGMVAGWLLWPNGVMRSPAVVLSIMVLPFHNLSDKLEDYLADGVTDDLTTELARLPGSFVIARDTAETYLERHAGARDIGRALNVKYLLEGGVMSDGGTLRINARLIDTQTDAQLWAKRFSVSRDRLADARDLIAGQIVATLGAVLVQAESQRSTQDHPDDPTAVDLLLRARYVLDLGDALSDYQAAQGLLEAALREQPDFADALAELGWLLVCKIENVDDPDQNPDEAHARQVIGYALRLRPHDERALAAQGRLLSIEGDYAGAIASARQALAVQPNEVDAEWVLGSAEYYLGHLEAAAVPIEASLRMDPEGPHSKQRYQRLGSIQLFAGHYAEAITNLQKAAAGDVPPAPGDGAWGRLERVRLMLIAAVAQSDPDKARALYAAYAKIWPHRSVWRIGTLAPQTLGSLAGFKSFLDALAQAGMDRFADEAADDHVAPSSTALTGGDFTPTPLVVPGANRIDTAGLVKLLHSGTPVLVIDLGTGTAVIPGAVWGDSAALDKGDDAFADRQANAFLEHYANAPVVVMADGTYGVTSYNAALHLASPPGRQVFWYRGGEEAWAKAGLRGSYKRSD